MRNSSSVKSDKSESSNPAIKLQHAANQLLSDYKDSPKKKESSSNKVNLFIPQVSRENFMG